MYSDVLPFFFLFWWSSSLSYGYTTAGHSSTVLPDDCTPARFKGNPPYNATLQPTLQVDDKNLSSGTGVEGKISICFPAFLFVVWLCRPVSDFQKYCTTHTLYKKSKGSWMRIWVLFLQFGILYQSSRFHHRNRVRFFSCCKLHNMIVDRRYYAGTLEFCDIIWQTGSCEELILGEMFRPEWRYAQAAQWRAYLDMLKDISKQKQFTDA